MTDNQSAGGAISAGLRPEPELTDWHIALTMTRAHSDDPDNHQHEYRVFHLTVPAASREDAAQGVTDFGYAINNASDHRWKFTNDRGCTITQATPAADPMPVFVLKAKDALALEAIRAYRESCILHLLTEQADEVNKAMPAAWQHRMVACLQELDAAYDVHVDKPTAFIVTPAVEREYSELAVDDMFVLGITDTNPESDNPDGLYWDRNGNEHGPHDRVLVPRPGGDPVPHYNRGRTHIPPQIGS